MGNEDVALSLARDPEYLKWLQGLLSVPVTDAHGFLLLEGESHQSLLSLPMSVKNDVGHREVGLNGVAKISQTLCVQGKWREYDTADMCLLEENSAVYYVKFHHRALALHLICAFFIS